MKIFIYIDTVRDDRYNYGVINGEKSTKRQPPDDTSGDKLRPATEGSPPTIRRGDQIGDENLTRAYQSGEGQALNTLLEHYDQPLRNFIRTISWLKDESFIDEVLQSTRVTIFEEIRKGRFVPTGAGSFKAWAYTVCQNVCWNTNKDRARQPKRISELYPEEPTGMPENLLPKMPMRTVNYERLATKLKDVTSHLSPEEQKLMTLVSQHKKYQEIQQDPDFAKYSLDYLMRKVYNIRKKMRKAKEKEKKK